MGGGDLGSGTLKGYESRGLGAEPPTGSGAEPQQGSRGQSPWSGGLGGEAPQKLRAFFLCKTLILA